VSKAEIIKQLPKLSQRERREIARLIFEIEDDQKILADTDRRANERFLMLDEMEAKYGKAKSQ
jgi:mRNA-degrading endonuclease RelE of RelBE toxin-antitoxin system